MIKCLRQILIILSLIGITVSIILLLNFTASNPTGRRYSSQTLDLSLDNAAKGIQAEAILAHDLKLERNETSGLVCFCKSGLTGRCNSCAITTDNLIGSHRIPDFITSKHIIEVKNHDGLLYEADSRDFQQITDHAVAARQLGLKLWVFVRTDTPVSPALIEIVESTGGRVVYYLAVPGYADETDQKAATGAGITSILLAGCLILEFRSRRIRPSLQPPTQSPSPTYIAVSKVDALDKFVKKAKDDTRLKIDIEDERQI